MLALTFLFLSLIPTAQTSDDNPSERLKSPTPKEKVDMYLDIAKMYWRNSTDSIYIYSKKALDLANKTGYAKGKAQALAYIGVTHFYRADYDSVLYYYDAAIALFKQCDETGSAAITLNNKGVLHKRMGEYQKALDCYHEAMTIQESLGDTLEMGGIMLNIGNIHYLQNRFDEALGFYFKALEKFESINNKVKIASAYTNIGEVYADLKKHIQALGYYQKSLELQKEMNDQYGMANSFSNIGIIKKTLKAYTEAEFNLNQAIGLYTEMQDKDAIAWVLNHLGELYTLTGQTDIAFSIYNKSLRLQESIGDDEGLAQVKLSIARLHFYRKEWAQARERLNESIETGTKHHLLMLLQESYLLLSQVDSAQKKDQESLIHYKIYSRYKDTIYNEESSRQIAEMQTKYETAKKEQEINRLQQEKKVKEIQMKNNLLTGLIGLIALVIFFSFLFLLYRYKQRKQKTKLLLKNTMETEDKERKIFAEELHDGIGPLLSTVKMYINELNGDVISSSTKELLTESNKIIDEAVSASRDLSHNLMPQNIEEKGLVRSLKIFADRVCLKEIPVIQFDIDKPINYGSWQQVMIYRIVTELISNSIKHASASSVKVSMKEKNKNLIIVYEDTGCGFNTDEVMQNSAGIGLKNIVSRTKSLNGKVLFDTDIGKGFKARIEFNVNDLYN